jgi:AbrB family looped-hinge helix DNA binding protein
VWKERTMAVFKSTLVKWGNSVGVNIPKPIRDTLNWEAGDEVELVDKENYIIIRKAAKK